MPYVKRSDIPVQAGEQAVELDTGALVAVCCDRKRVDAGVCYHAQARAVDEAGATLLYPDGRAIATALKHSVPAETVETLTDDAITRECLLVVLGEPVSLFPWAPSLLASSSIRVSLAAAAVSGPADAGAVL